PTELKDILKYLGIDIRDNLIHNDICIKYYSKDIIDYKHVCEKIDEMMIKKYDKYMNEIEDDPKKQPDSNFVKAASILIESYFNELKDNQKDLQRIFPVVFSEKDNILLNVVFNNETRTNIMELSEKCDENQLMLILLKNSTIREMIINGEITDNCDLIKKIVVRNPVPKRPVLSVLYPLPLLYL
ncbi:hypothetical protein BCR36DRAFT_284235, partial [Piromyces finnis]